MASIKDNRRPSLLLASLLCCCLAVSCQAATDRGSLAADSLRGFGRLLQAAPNKVSQQFGFGDRSTTRFGNSDNQRVATSADGAALGQPIAVARTATAAAVPCEVLVQQQTGDGYGCSGGFCLQSTLYVKNWLSNAVLTPWTLKVSGPAFTGVAGAYNSNATFAGTTVTAVASLAWEVLQPNGGNSINVGWAQAASAAPAANFFPTSITLNNQACAITTVWTDSPAPPPGSTPAPTKAPTPTAAAAKPPPPAAPAPPAPPSPPPAPPYNVPGSPVVAKQAVSVSGTKIIGVDGKEVQFKGINYFGFENGNTAPDGIWQGDQSITRDLVTIMRRHRLLGFNAVRLPFSMSSLFTGVPRNFNGTCQTTSDAALLAATTEPGIITPAVGVKLGYEPPSVPGYCDSYLPNDSVYNRFLFFVNFLARNGIYVLVDNHLNSDNTIVSQGQAVWLAYWARIMTAIKLDPVSSKFVMYDILNEPDSQGIPWENSGSGQPGSPKGMADNYLAMMDQGYKINPQAVYFIEGCAQGSISANWGDGFSTGSQFPTGSSGSPTRFFTTLLTKAYKNNVVISPHVYPPTITNAAVGYTGASLNTRLTTAHGYLNKAPGFCDASGNCKTFPIVVGEFGTRLTDSRDLLMMPQYANYLNNVGNGADGGHNPITSWFWWCWNANSGDTGGIVDDDWLTILWRKPDYLETVGLQPFYAQYRTGAGSPNAPTSPAGPGGSTPTSAPLPALCSKGSYRAPGKCAACVSSAKPFTKTYGGYQCSQPTTLSDKSTTCTNLILPASIKGSSNANLATCITAGSGATITLFLPLTSSVAPFLNGTKSYTKASLRLASSIPPKKYSDGSVVYQTVAIGASGNKRMQVQFTDTFNVLAGFRGKNVQINGVLSRGGTLLPQCFSSVLKVCA